MLDFLKFIFALCVFCPIVGPLAYTSEYFPEIQKYINPKKFTNGVRVLWYLNHTLYSSGRQWGNVMFGIILWPFEILSFLWALVFFVPWRSCKFIFIALFKARGE